MCGIDHWMQTRELTLRRFEYKIAKRAAMKVIEDINRSLTDYSILLTNKFVAIGFSFISAVLLTRILGTDGYGKFNLFYLVANIAFIGLINWTSASVLRFGKEEFIIENRINKVFWTRNIFVASGVILFFIVLSILRHGIEEYTKISCVWRFIAAFIILQVFLDYLNYIFQATSQLKASSFVGVLVKFIFLLSVLFLFYSDRKGIREILFAYILSQFLTVLIFLKWIDFSLFFPIAADWRTFKKILTFSYPLIFSSLSAYVISYIDLVFIKRYLSISDVGTYSLSYNLMNSFQQILMVIITVTTPILIGLYTEGREEIIRDYLRKLTPQGVFLWSTFLTISIGILPFIIPFIFGNTFEASILPMQILLLGLVWNAISCFYSGVLTTYKLIKKMVLMTILMAVINLLGDMLLVPRLGINGAAISSASVFSLGGIAYMRIGNRRLNLREYRALLFLIPVLVTFTGILCKFDLILISIAVVFLYYFILHKFQLFADSDIAFLDHVSMPAYLRRVLHKSYYLLNKA
jgi:O-antigen/teichoic acid export membrane protein